MLVHARRSRTSFIISFDSPHFLPSPFLWLSFCRSSSLCLLDRLFYLSALTLMKESSLAAARVTGRRSREFSWTHGRDRCRRRRHRRRRRRTRDPTSSPPSSSSLFLFLVLPPALRFYKASDGIQLEVGEDLACARARTPPSLIGATTSVCLLLLATAASRLASTFAEDLRIRTEPRCCLVVVGKYDVPSRERRIDPRWRRQLRDHAMRTIAKLGLWYKPRKKLR